MIRLLGAITGSALALAALLVLVGVPQFKAEPNELEQVVVTLPLRAEPVDDAIREELEKIVDEALPTPAQMSEPEQPPAAAVFEAAATSDPNNTQPNDTQPNDKPPHDMQAATVAEEIPPFEDVPALQPDSQQWYAFWSPFRSEIAASGFVAQLQRVTGLDYRVVKVKPGVYEVAFAYAEDGDILSNLSQISAATGLDMPGN